jgi:hypothetical protein
MLELVRDIGSVVGLITGFFYAFDRLVRGRPVASLTISEEKGGLSPRISITNISSYDIAIEDVTIRSNAYRVAMKQGAEGNLEASFEVPVYFMLKPNERRELRIVALFKDGVPIEVTGDQSVTFFVWWRRGNATWLPQFPVTVRTSVARIRKYGLERPDVQI